jgi:acyl carrier protein
MINQQKFLQVVSECLGVAANTINETTEIQEIEAWDSVMSLQLMLRLENTFEVKIPLYKFLKAKTIKDVINQIEMDSVC